MFSNFYVLQQEYFYYSCCNNFRAKCNNMHDNKCGKCVCDEVIVQK